MNLALRIVLGLVALAMAGYGVLLLLDQGWPDLLHIGLWLGGGVALHDGVFGPLVIVLTVFGLRLVPAAHRARVVVALVVLVTVTITAIPVLGMWGERPDNVTLLDRPYLLGWLIFAGLVLGTTLVSALLGSRRARQKE